MGRNEEGLSQSGKFREYILNVQCEKRGLKMIFVTVGTHEQPFNRLIRYMDNLKEGDELQEEIILQTGFSTYKPRNCPWSALYSYQDMMKFVEEARIVITHGGPSSFIMALQAGKVPIVVPRKKCFREHVNNHQVKFARAVEERQKNIIVVENIEELKGKIDDYERIVSLINIKLENNQMKFNEEFERLVEGILMKNQ